MPGGLLKEEKQEQITTWRAFLKTELSGLFLATSLPQARPQSPAVSRLAPLPGSLAGQATRPAPGSRLPVLNTHSSMPPPTCSLPKALPSLLLFGWNLILKGERPKRARELAQSAREPAGVPEALSPQVQSQHILKPERSRAQPPLLSIPQSRHVGLVLLLCIDSALEKEKEMRKNMKKKKTVGSGGGSAERRTGHPG